MLYEKHLIPAEQTIEKHTARIKQLEQENVSLRKDLAQSSIIMGEIEVKCEQRYQAFNETIAKMEAKLTSMTSASKMEQSSIAKGSATK